jgi:hypothetical protein
MRHLLICKKIQWVRWIFVLFLALSCSAPVQAGTTGLFDRALKAGFVPHKALYDIRLAGTRSGSQIVNISGRMLYEWRPKCDAWESNHRFDLSYEYADSPAMRITSDFTTYETHDGKTMNFSSQRRRDGALFEELRGYAALEENGTGKAVYTKPENLVFDLPAGSVFPMEHSLKVLENIQKKNRFYKAVIFDGSDQEGPVEINAFIGKPVNALAALEGKKLPSVDASLLKGAARQVRLAFFPLREDSPASDYEMTMEFLENGIISDMLIEYHDFSVSQKLVALEKLSGGCEDVKSEP